MDKVPIEEETALRVQIDLVVDRTTGHCRWVTHGMTSVHDLREQDLIYRALQLMLDASLRVTNAQSQAIN